MVILQALAEGWGVATHRRGKVVWFMMRPSTEGEVRNRVSAGILFGHRVTSPTPTRTPGLTSHVRAAGAPIMAGLARQAAVPAWPVRLGA
jgi:hypothetical protein